MWVPEFEDEGTDSVSQCDRPDWEKNYLDLTPERPLRQPSMKFLAMQSGKKGERKTKSLFERGRNAF